MNVVMEVPVEDLHSQEIVRGVLYDSIDVAYAGQADTMWTGYVDERLRELSCQGKPLPNLEHVHWSWHKKVELTKDMLPYSNFAIEVDGNTEALMLLQTDGKFAKSQEHSGKPLVYIVFLSTAPWNLHKLAHNPRYRGLGTILIRFAIKTSIDLGFHGYIGLHSLPQSEDFYRKLGMMDFGPDSTNKENLAYMEMPPTLAQAFIK